MPDYNIERNAKQCRVVLAGDLTAAIVTSLQMALKSELAQDTEEVVFDL